MPGRLRRFFSPLCPPPLHTPGQPSHTHTCSPFHPPTHTLLPPFPALAAPARPTLGALEEELEAVEPAVADAAPALTKVLGAGEVSEIEAEVQAIAAATDALDGRAADGIGAETAEIDAAAAPLLARIEAVRELIGLAGAKE